MILVVNMTTTASETSVGVRRIPPTRNADGAMATKEPQTTLNSVDLLPLETRLTVSDVSNRMERTRNENRPRT